MYHSTVSLKYRILQVNIDNIIYIFLLLVQLPPDIGKLVKLDSLQLSDNRLTSITLSVSMKALKTIDLSNNKLKTFPKEICSLPHIDAVDMSGNSITSLPEDVGDLHAIELNMNRNRLNSLPDSLSKCKRLKVLRIEENCLPVSSLSPAILKESQISVLAFDGNLFDMKAFQEVEGYDEVG